MLADILTKITTNKTGVEIGGPSTQIVYANNIIYKNAISIDNERTTRK